MKLSFNLLDSTNVITKNILSILRDELNKAFVSAIPNIRTKIKDLIKEALITEPEYSSLISGKLKYEFGIPTAKKVDSVIDIWIQNIIVNYSAPVVRSSTISGGFSISAIQSDYSDVLSNDSAVIVDSVSGAVLPWLEWLLLSGGQIIVRNYRVKMGSNRASRTGMAIMVESPGDSWRVPPEFAGTSNNNWVTRALSKIDDKILDIIQLEIERKI